MHLASESSLPRMEVSSGAGPDDDQPKRGTVYTVTHFLKAGLFSFLGVSFFFAVAVWWNIQSFNL